tara:strand:+ start:1068 stop:1448 length:381 start_codon:yes stop_codon:yes gene_type:complete
MSKAFKDFDLDLRFGQEGEEWLRMLAKEQTIEVKRERDKWATTGNIVFEIRCNGVPSGLSATKSDWWAHILSIAGQPQSVILLRTEKLKERLRELITSKHLKITRGGDGNRVEMILLPIDEIHLLL